LFSLYQEKFSLDEALFVQNYIKLQNCPPESIGIPEDFIQKQDLHNLNLQKRSLLNKAIYEDKIYDYSIGNESLLADKNLVDFLGDGSQKRISSIKNTHYLKRSGFNNDL
jgi:hypothetical protein